MKIWIVFSPDKTIERLFADRDAALDFVQTQVQRPELKVSGPYWVEGKKR